MGQRGLFFYENHSVFDDALVVGGRTRVRHIMGREVVVATPKANSISVPGNKSSMASSTVAAANAPWVKIIGE